MFALEPQLQQRVTDLRMGITSCPVDHVTVAKAHLLDLFVAYDAQVAEVSRLQTALVVDTDPE